MISELKLIVFDWDGTLMDSIERIVNSFRSAMRETGLPVLAEDEIKAIIGLGLPEAVAAMYPEASLELRLRLARCYREHYLRLDPTPMRPFDGAEALLAELAQRGYWLAVATGKSRKGLDRALAETGLGRYFFATRCAEETASKPNPQMLRELLLEAGAEPAQAVMIGDTHFDLEMARNARMPSIGVAHGVHARETLEAYEPLDIVSDLHELAALLRQARPLIHIPEEAEA